MCSWDLFQSADFITNKLVVYGRSILMFICALNNILIFVLIFHMVCKRIVSHMQRSMVCVLKCTSKANVG